MSLHFAHGRHRAVVAVAVKKPGGKRRLCRDVVLCVDSRGVAGDGGRGGRPPDGTVRGSVAGEETGIRLRTGLSNFVHTVE